MHIYAYIYDLYHLPKVSPQGVPSSAPGTQSSWLASRIEGMRELEIVRGRLSEKEGDVVSRREEE